MGNKNASPTQPPSGDSSGYVPQQTFQQQHPVLGAIATGMMGYGQGMTGQPYLTNYQNLQSQNQENDFNRWLGTKSLGLKKNELKNELMKTALERSKMAKENEIFKLINYWGKGKTDTDAVESTAGWNMTQNGGNPYQVLED